MSIGALSWVVDSTGYGQAPWDMRSLDAFESSVGKRVSIVHFGHSFRNSDGSEGRFPAAQMKALRARGVIPFLLLVSSEPVR